MARPSMRLAVAAACAAGAAGQDWDEVLKAFEKFQKDFEKTYEEAEKEMRFTAFAKNFAIIAEENAKGHGYKLGLNPYADLSSEEFAKTKLGYKPRAGDKPWGNLASLGVHKSSGAAVPASVDWSQSGAVTGVKNQGQCGSCWAFSSTGALEGAWEIATGKLVSLSEQQLVDCSTAQGNQGCSGGLMDNAFTYEEGVGVCSEDSYAYTAQDGTCQASSCTVAIPQGGVTGFKDVSPNDEEALMEAVAQQPVSVAIEADQSVFQLYQSGVLNGACGTQLDHGVLVVGYGVENGAKYWLVKNSWGAGWGLNGYVKIARGTGGSGMCGILSQPSYPVVQGSQDELSKAFEKFQKDFEKKYEEAERDLRKAAFAKNYAFVAEENAKGHSYQLAINEYADLTAEEFARTKLGYNASSKPWGTLASLGVHVSTGAAVPDSVDWSQKGAVTGVKNQGQCGSCWAFSTTGALEGAWEVATGKLVSLSEQQLVDCSKAQGNQGCSGGLMDNGFTYEEGVGSCTEESYAYTAKDGTCHASSCTVAIPKGDVTGFKDVSPNDEQALMEAVAQQPVSVAIEADQSVFQLYTSGVLDGSCGTQLDHGVLVVGYGVESGKKYWLVKNSWGAGWGLNGYVKIARGTGGSGMCGILSQPSYPVVKSSEAALVV